MDDGASGPLGDASEQEVSIVSRQNQSALATTPETLLNKPVHLPARTASDLRHSHVALQTALDCR